MSVREQGNGKAHSTMIILSFACVSRLQSVDVSENGLTLIPPPHAWKSLGVREIKYTANKLTKVDLSEGKRFWSHLESFYIGQNKIKEVTAVSNDYKFDTHFS